MAQLPATLAAVLLVSAAAAHAQDADGPVATSNGQSWASEAAPGEPEVVRPAPAIATTNPLAALNDVPRDRTLKGYHGSAGVVVGSHDTRGAYATVNGPIGDSARFSLGVSTFSTDAYPYAYGYPYGYGGGTRSSLGASFEWRPNNDRPPFAYDPYQADWPGYPGRSGEYTTDVTDAPGR